MTFKEALDVYKTTKINPAFKTIQKKYPFDWLLKNCRGTSPVANMEYLYSLVNMLGVDISEKYTFADVKQLYNEFVQVNINEGSDNYIRDSDLSDYACTKMLLHTNLTTKEQVTTTPVTLIRKCVSWPKFARICAIPNIIEKVKKESKERNTYYYFIFNRLFALIMGIHYYARKSPQMVYTHMVQEVRKMLLDDDICNDINQYLDRVTLCRRRTVITYMRNTVIPRIRQCCNSSIITLLGKLTIINEFHPDVPFLYTGRMTHEKVFNAIDERGFISLLIDPLTLLSIKDNHGNITSAIREKTDAVYHKVINGEIQTGKKKNDGNKITVYITDVVSLPRFNAHTIDNTLKILREIRTSMVRLQPYFKLDSGSISDRLRDILNCDKDIARNFTKNIDDLIKVYIDADAEN